MTDKELLLELRQEFVLYKETTQKIIEDLQDCLAKYENPKNSSSIASSQNPFRKTKNLRGKSSKSQGVQKGHKGSKLKKNKQLVLHNIQQAFLEKSYLPIQINCTVNDIEQKNSFQIALL